VGPIEPGIEDEHIDKEILQELVESVGVGFIISIIRRMTFT